MTRSKSFYQELGDHLATKLPGDFRFLRGSLELKRRVANGYDVIQIHGNNKYSPLVDIFLSFGKRFDDVAKIEKLMGCTQFPTHIQVTTGLTGKEPTFPYLGPCVWSVDIDRPPETLGAELLCLVEGLGFPFFGRFTSLIEARDELERRKSVWCNDFHWMQLFHLNAALSEDDRFLEWSANLPPFQKNLAVDYVEKFRSLAVHK